MPYLSWSDGSLTVRHALEGDCCLGRDASLCSIIHPMDMSLSRCHAAVTRIEGAWWVRDLESANGTMLNGLPVPSPGGGRLQDGDIIQAGDWQLTYTDGFPGLDGTHFAERVGTLFEEVRPEPAQAMVLIRGMELLQRSVESLLQEGTSEKLIQGFLAEALKLLRADRGFLVMVEADGTWRRVVQIGEADERLGLSQTILQYVAHHGVAVLSNSPLMDPRFQGTSVADMHRGALMCAPMALDGLVMGILYLDRRDEARPFSRFDLSLFQAFVRLGAVALRHTQLAQGAMGQAEALGELARLKARVQDWGIRAQALWMEMASCLRWLQAGTEGAMDPGILRTQVGRLTALCERGMRDEPMEVLPPELFGALRVDQLAARLHQAWRDLAASRGVLLILEPPGPGETWTAGDLATQAIQGLVDPLLFHLGPDARVTGSWGLEADTWCLRLLFPKGMPGPQPESWTLRALREANLTWKWANQTLSITLPRADRALAATSDLPLLGLISSDHDMLGLFQRVAEANGCTLIPLTEEPPHSPLPPFRYLVLDALEVPDPTVAIRAYRSHPEFALVPILVVKVTEAQLPDIMAAGATDWLQEGFHWETLHQRLVVLKGHQDLQRQALASERLESFKQMAGTLKHEINNPLAVISMQVELLQRKYEDEPKLQKIGEMVDRIRGLVQVLQKMREATSEEYPGGGTIIRL